MTDCLTATDFADLLEKAAVRPHVRNHLDACGICGEQYRLLLAAQHALESAGKIFQEQCLPAEESTERAKARVYDLMRARRPDTSDLELDGAKIRLLRDLIRPACGERASSLLVEEAASRVSHQYFKVSWADFLGMFADLFSELCGEAAGRMVLLCAKKL